MPGRQSHGRPLLAAPKTKTIKRSKSRSQKSALNAFNTASEQYPTRIKKTPRARELDAEIERKHGRDDDDEDDDEDDEEGPTRKKARRPARNGDAEYGSDSEGNEWQLGGMAEDDEDSEIESDDAFGDSDNEKFEEYQFRGGKSKKIQDDDSEDDSNDDEGQTLGDEAIDLATALDQFEEDSDEEEGSQDSSDDDDEDGSDEEEDDSDDEDDEEADPEKLNALQGLISGYGGEEPAADEKPSSKQKIGFDDLGLSGLNDPLMRKSVKLMNKEEKAKRPGAAKKLDVPLSRREQGRLDRSAAYETTNKTLDRWTETIQYNRRAEHLVFPLPENAADAGLDRAELQPLSTAKPANELESAVMSIMEQSGLSLAKPQKPKKVEYDDEGNELTRREAANRRRLERELNSREAKRAKRIKKIKSKAYHRVHRKERERDELATKEAMEEAGELDSEAEREAQDRRRALERVGQRHKDSKWAKLGNKTKRAVWDDEFRTGLTEMAQRDEELRRRKEGKRGGTNGDDSDATSSSGSDSDDDGDAKLRRQLAELEQDDDDEPRSKLMSMKFMQNAEAARKQENDQLIKDIRKELDGDEASGSNSDDEAAADVGRRSYGDPGAKIKPVAIDLSKKKQAKKTRAAAQEDEDEDDVVITTSNGASSANAAWAAPAEAATATTGAWSRGEMRRKSKGGSTRAEDLDLNSHVVVAAEAVEQPPRRKSKPAPSAAAAAAAAESDSDDDQQHLPMAERERALVARAFAGEDVVADFAREKEAATAADDDRVVDATLPGWGAWVGEGVSKREQARNAGRYLRTVQGVVKPKDRRDAKLDKVVMNEKTIKKNNLYRASQLPHPFETREQYERSLRLPVGPEWMTRETFQESTKPRVMIKQGVITPMSKPTR
ncbi:small nucleolar ribonucleoprotein complex subunit Utp14 [Cordyceps fumosorosea ARSEF 2679]|uniref:Small nucleolar ribonucleoprotein complex subunit Utp14 n=1 Tax=Cordyceps fumosorosea (strain ARSEF 2679) TaxID=1081104 RepID=A0A162MTV2_CORFA|nr:small nucleolar ribonucleoprotein complex subunit Utp14 [Cordyceps fumosorosea ARSEF 2679]OAA70259.1 small nucleolar ribonucleoprotein complex subunit Utp14 [Cordyceps fumosorosea ARSEF 2679]